MADVLRMAVLTSSIRVGLVLPLVIAIIVLMLAGHQASGFACPFESEGIFAHMSETDLDCMGNDPMHSTSCCFALAPSAVAIGFDTPSGLIGPIDPRSVAADPTPPSRLFRPPRTT